MERSAINSYTAAGGFLGLLFGLWVANAGVGAGRLEWRRHFARWQPGAGRLRRCDPTRYDRRIRTPEIAMTDPYNSAPAAATAQGLTDAMVTTALELPGYRVVRNLGIVRGLTVRSRSVVGNFIGGLQTLFGGNITIYTELCEQARHETYREMLMHARQLGANAIIAVRYDATELMAGLTEVLCYGTAVVVRPHPDS
ncbi:hypothetical protein P873_10225 [Arenimonas composti TR7-09 = DSM 18010]|uniref:UPF0145 protein P873_10225 n=2 Tax=Arenimonas TaxID=490567 RepID=A0A091BYT9_9GAMM|nr:hypothetical protein P873_10225 [Arenimonas composti TR7-09 = DSM 18010]